MKISFERLREVLKEELLEYIGEPILLPYGVEFLDKLLFERDHYKQFSETLQPVLKKINYSNVSFDKFIAKEFDFSPYTGIKINPQTLYARDLFGSRCKGVEFIGPFDGVWVKDSDFTGSKGAKINPQTLYARDLRGTICSDVEFIGMNGAKADFTGVNIIGTNFNGSNYEDAIKEEYEFREKIKLMTNGNVHVK